VGDSACEKCGGKGKLERYSLRKSGAEKLSMTFCLLPAYEVTIEDMGGGHRNYQVTCRLTNSQGLFAGEGVGSCSTAEGKYRYRWDNTWRPVPGSYWATKDPNVLGGPQFIHRKAWIEQEGGGRKQEWFIFERVDHDNPADYYNTALKMAKKRAQVDATITATAASDIFTQDVDEDEEAGGNGGESGTSAGGPTKQPTEPPPPSSIRGKIAANNDKDREQNPKRPMKVKVGDKWFQTFADSPAASKLIDAQQSGAEVVIHFEVKKQGDYTNNVIVGVDLEAPGGEA